MRYLLTVMLAFILIGAAVEDARKANEAYDNGDYKKAIMLYKRAIQQDAENPKLYFNLGNALAKNGSTEEAIRYYEQYKQMTDDPAEKAKADYNIGNIYSQNKKWGQATQFYKKAMRRESGDIDAKHNYELAQKKQQQQQQNQQNQDDKNKDQQKKDQDQQQQKENQNNDQQQKQNQDKQQQQNQNQQQKNEQQQKQKQQPKPAKISKAEAEKILKALEQQEKDLLKNFKKKKTEASKNTHEKDW